MIKPDFNKFSKKQSCLFGALTGDSIGSGFEFKIPSRIDADYIANPNTIPDSYHTHPEHQGKFTDDFSQTLCVEECINNPDMDFNREMLLWQEGKYWIDETLFDIGNQTWAGLNHYKSTGNILYNEFGSGNGSAMRLAPLAFVECSLAEREQLVKKYCEITHNNEESFNASYFYVTLLNLLANKSGGCFSSVWNDAEDITGWKVPSGNRNRLGSGYIVDSLNAIGYCIETSSSFEDAVTLAIEIGGDTDTNALFVGSVAALYFGIDDISNEWLEYIQPSLQSPYVKKLFDL